MRGRTILNFAGALALCLFAAAGAAAQDFQRSYSLGDGGSVQIANVSGDIELKGYDGSAVVVNAHKTGRDRDQVEVEDNSTPGRVSLRVRYAGNCYNCNASIKFEVMVPRSGNVIIEKITTASGNVSAEGFSGRVSLSTASGDVTVRRVSGRIKASSASGTVRVEDASGSVNASSASGNVDVELTRLDGDGDMHFSSASGDVNVRLPSSVSARVSMSTATGSIETNFPIEVRPNRYGPGSRADGLLGSGSRILKLSSASGNISLKSI